MDQLSFLNGSSDIQARSDSWQRRNILPFSLHSIWWKAASYTFNTKPRYSFFPVFASWPIHWSSKFYLIKMHLNRFSCASALLCYPSQVFLGYLLLTSIRKFCSKFSNYSIFLEKIRVKQDDWNIWDYCFSFPFGFWNYWMIHNSFPGMNTILLAASKSW